MFLNIYYILYDNIVNYLLKDKKIILINTDDYKKYFLNNYMYYYININGTEQYHRSLNKVNFRNIKMNQIKTFIHRNDGPAIIFKSHQLYLVNGLRHRDESKDSLVLEDEDGPCVVYFNNKAKNSWYINNIYRNDNWVKKYLKIKNNHLIDGVIVSNKWKIREIILRWRYDPKFNCVKKRLKKDYEELYN